jgi:hypothetical protein
MKKITSVLFLAVAAACFWLSGRTNESLLGLRKQYRLDQADPLDNSPPLVAFTTVAMGGFRGILADMLWVRASTLQEEGKYFELVQLADWITKLEPRFADVWAFHAWNLAYNISVLFNSPEDRWRWVRHGIELLRDEGLRYNPGNAALCHELGWMFQHKIGADYDEMHMYYKQAWAREMMTLFDGPRPDYANLPATVSNRLMTAYKLNPAVLKQIDIEYGPLDWRLPPAHALYWALKSRGYASGFDVVAADRMIFQSLADEFKEGALLFRPDEGVFVLTPSLDILPKTEAVYEKAIADHPDQNTIKLAYENFLRDAVVVLFTSSHYDDARKLYEKIKERFPSEHPPADLENFLFQSITGGAPHLSREDAMAMLEELARQSFFWQALGENGRAEGFQQLAEICRQKCFADSRENLPSWKQIRESARERILANPPSTKARERLTSDAGTSTDR